MITTIKVTAIIARGNNLLLIKEWSKKRRGYFWNVVKGTYDSKKDKDLISAISREAREEVSLSLKVTGLASVFILKRKNNMTVQFNFSCQALSGKRSKLRKRYEKNEKIIASAWFSKGELIKLGVKQLFNMRTKKIIDDFCTGTKATSLDFIRNFRELT